MTRVRTEAHPCDVEFLAVSRLEVPAVQRVLGRAQEVVPLEGHLQDLRHELRITIQFLTRRGADISTIHEAGGEYRFVVLEDVHHRTVVRVHCHLLLASRRGVYDAKHSKKIKYFADKRICGK
jgi:hypothetical protein